MNRRPQRGNGYHRWQQRPNENQSESNQPSDWSDIQEQPNFRRNQNNHRNFRRGRRNFYNHGARGSDSNSWRSDPVVFNNLQGDQLTQGYQKNLFSFQKPSEEREHDGNSQYAASYADSDVESVHSTSSQPGPYSSKKNAYKWTRNTSTEKDSNSEHSYYRPPNHLNKQKNIYQWHRNTSKESLLESDDKTSDSSQNNSDYLHYKQQKNNLHDGKEHVSSEEDIQLPANNDKMNEVENLSYQLNSLLQTVHPTDIIKRCRKNINELSEKFVEKHEENFAKISECIQNSDDKMKKVFSEHCKLMRLQQTVFERYIAHVKSSLTDVYNLPSAETVIRCNEVLNDVKMECKLFKRCLNIYALKDDIKTSVEKNKVTIMVSDPCYGAGAIIPKFLFDSHQKGIIISCFPNIALCYNQYQFCVSCSGKSKLETVNINYRVSSTAPLLDDTKILFTTTGELFSCSLKDPDFTLYSCVIITCALQRATETDFLLEILRKCILSRHDLKLVIVLQASQNIELFEKYFSCTGSVNVITAPNLILPVKTVWKTGSLSEDYVAEVIQTALAIHAVKTEGNVLIFLPDVKNFKTLSLSLNAKLQEHGYSDARCIQIFEDILEQEFIDLTENTKMKHTFVLATSWAEQLIIPSVSYVIDCGQVSNSHYDPTRCLEIKSLTFVSSVTAKARKSYVGRNIGGTCYRLFNKRHYRDDMPTCEQPQILRENPIDVVMKMFQYKAVDALNTNFVEDLSQEVKENALMLLKNANAVNDRELTPLGARIIKLPFLPRYSKLIILGIDWGFSFQAVLLVAYFLIKRPLFVHSTKRELHQIAEGKKLQFLIGDSDTLTFLNVYQSWLTNKCAKSWCMNNCLNFEVLRQIQNQAEEVINTVSRRLDTVIIPELNDVVKMDWRALQDIIYDCFRDNLCIYSGHYRSGYRLITSEYVTFIHPSSPVLQKEDLPQFVVFADVQATSRNFMMNVTAIPNDIVMKDNEKGLLGKDASKLFQSKLEPFVLDRVGIMFIKKVLLGKKGLKLREIEDKIKKDTNTNLIVIEPSEENGTVTVFTLPEYREKVEKILREMVKEKLEDLLHEKETLPLPLKKSLQKVTVAVTWTTGCTVTDLKTSYENDLEGQDVKESSASSSNGCSIKYSVNLSWPRRLCRGLGFLTFSENDFVLARRLSMTTIKVLGVNANVQINNKEMNQLFISKLHEQTTEKDLEMAIKANLPKEITVMNSKIVHQKAFKTSEADIETTKEKLVEICSKLKTTGDVSIVVQMPDDSATEMRAFINMTNSSDVEIGTKFLNGCLYNNLIIKALSVYSTIVFCNFEVFKALKARIDQDLKWLRISLSRDSKLSHIAADRLFDVDVKFPDSNTASIKLLANRIEILNTVHNEFNKLLEGEIVNCHDIKGLHKLFTHGGHLWLRRLEKLNNIHVIEDYKCKILRLYGDFKSCKKAIDSIKKFMIDVENELVKVVDLKSGNNTKTLLKELLQKYGFDFKRFIEDFHLRSAELNIRTSKLTLHGSGENIEEAEAAIEEIAKTCFTQAKEEFSLSQESCSVCGVPPLQFSLRLEHCGHLYCIQCLKGMITNSSFPIVCCDENCDKEVILEDIRKGLDCEEDEIEILTSRALADYISKNSAHYVYCPAPDCSMFFDKRNESGTTGKCKLCENTICFKCNAIFHHGYTCEMFQGSKNDPDFSFKTWMKERNPNCRQCPRCKTAIEKTAGCNHMTCHSCSAHFCWTCGKAFPTGNDVYDHLPYCVNYGR